ncbi:hypothetical protein T459_14894 [Capsicum annuum]|uniref:Uncharacterized protein n=1 Tax=Capsicum annuum TaxID=4072 RepID=A0A2G2ZIQ3_CAPAN|nr:putative LRR receptor-like serine/threonine-protein kinase-like [Capsicum annuum]PHT81879.1 hypothetical protein T459_14894 [Capsicum annuum]
MLWESDEMKVILSLFKRRIPQKPIRLKNRSRKFILKQVYKNLTFLIDLTREIQGLPTEENVSKVLSKWSPLLRKGSLSLTIRGLGYFELPERALEIFYWAKKQPNIFPDDHILASTIEVLARSSELKVSFDLDKFTGLASRNMCEAILRGCIKEESLKLALKIFSMDKKSNRYLDTGVYAKLKPGNSSEQLYPGPSLLVQSSPLLDMSDLDLDKVILRNSLQKLERQIHEL